MPWTSSSSGNSSLRAAWAPVIAAVGDELPGYDGLAPPEPRSRNHRIRPEFGPVEAADATAGGTAPAPWPRLPREQPSSIVPNCSWSSRPRSPARPLPRLMTTEAVRRTCPLGGARVQFLSSGLRRAQHCADSHPCTTLPPRARSAPCPRSPLASPSASSWPTSARAWPALSKLSPTFLHAFGPLRRPHRVGEMARSYHIWPSWSCWYHEVLDSAGGRLPLPRSRSGRALNILDNGRLSAYRFVTQTTINRNQHAAKPSPIAHSALPPATIFVIVALRPAGRGSAPAGLLAIQAANSSTSLFARSVLLEVLAQVPNVFA